MLVNQNMPQNVWHFGLSSYARVLIIIFCFHFNYFRQNSRVCYNVHRIDSQDSIEEWQVVEIISFPSFHGKINVDNMLQN